MNPLRSIGVLTIGNVISQGIAILGIIILSRFYTSSNFGSYAVVLGFVNIVSSISSFRYEVTILLPKKINISMLAVKVSLLNSVSVCLTVLIAILFFIYIGLLELFWLIVPFAAFFSSIINIASYLQNRQKNYLWMTFLQVSRSFLFVLLALIFSTRFSINNGLLLSMLGSLFVPAILIVSFDFRKSNLFKRNISKREFLFWLKKNKKFFCYSTPAVFVSSVASQAPVFLLSYFISDSLAGYYSIVQRVVIAPVVLISSSVNRVYMQAVTSKLSKGEDIYIFTRKIIKYFIFPSVVIASIMVLFFNYRLLEFFLGKEWSGIDAFAVVMIPAFLISFIAKSVSGFAVLNKNEVGLIYQVVLLVMVSLSVMLSSMLFESEVCIFISISLALTVSFTGQVISILLISKKIDGNRYKRSI